METAWYKTKGAIFDDALKYMIGKERKIKFRQIHSKLLLNYRRNPALAFVSLCSSPGLFASIARVSRLGDEPNAGGG